MSNYTNKQRWLIAAELAVIVGVAAVAVGTSRTDQWRDPVFLLMLLAAALVSDARPLQLGQIRISGSFIALVLAMTLAGPAPAVAMGAVIIAADAVRTRSPFERALANLTAFTLFPIIGATVVASVVPEAVERGTPEFAALVIGVFMGANILNFLTISFIKAGWLGLPVLRSVAREFRDIGMPLMPAQVATAILVAVLATSEPLLGAAVVVAALAVVGLLFQRLLTTTVAAQTRRDELEERTKELASLQVGLLVTVLRTLAMRDRMTARHSAAVAQYARLVAKHLDLSEREQEVIHIGGLLHDIGKFIFPDTVLFAAEGLTDDQLAIVRRHPAQGAELARRIEGYGPVAELIGAHHERPDGTGYPAGLAGEAIPLGARIVSVAEVYDVMTARDSYRQPVSPEEAVAEMKRVAGTQLDPGIVSAFEELVATGVIGAGLGDHADFERELEYERRVGEYARPRGL